MEVVSIEKKINHLIFYLPLMTNDKFLALPLLTPLGKNLGAAIERNSMERLLVYIYKF